MALVPLTLEIVKMNCGFSRIKINEGHDFVFFKVCIPTGPTFCYICINGIFLTSILIMKCPNFVYILLVPFASLGSTEHMHCNLICSIIKLNIYQICVNP